MDTKKSILSKLGRDIGIGEATGARAPFSIHQAVVNKLLSLTTSLPVESDNAQLLHTLLVLECELNGMCYFDNSNISLTVN